MHQRGVTAPRKDRPNDSNRESILQRALQALRGLETPDLRRVSRYLHDEILPKATPARIEKIEGFVGTCNSMIKLFELIRRVAPTDLPVLISGESGTGKELTARAIHQSSLRADKPFVPINSAAVPEALMEAELFGHTKGAFTGAHEAKKGKFELADQGTLFLDEIGDFPPSLQPKLLRFLEDQLIERLGSINGKKIDVRLIAATNRNLEEEITQGLFRQDLYHRLKVFTITLPPLRERGEDKLLLAQYFFRKFKFERDWACKGFSSEALSAIRQHSWPGNVREMINRIRRSIVVQDGWIKPEDMELSPGDTGTKTPKLREGHIELKTLAIESTLKENKYNVMQSARSLGISRTHLYSLIKEFSISMDRQISSVKR